MNVTLLCVGKTNIDWVNQALSIYEQRLSHYLGFRRVELADVKKASSLSRDSLKEEEGKLILSQLQKQDWLILLDERGDELTSVEMARRVEKIQSSGIKHLVLAIGGAYGFSSDVYNRANAKWSLSRLTFSHQMVRAIAVEQLYRCCTIIKGEPYHHQ